MDISPAPALPVFATIAAHAPFRHMRLWRLMIFFTNIAQTHPAFYSTATRIPPGQTEGKKIENRIWSNLDEDGIVGFRWIQLRTFVQELL